MIVHLHYVSKMATWHTREALATAEDNVSWHARALNTQFPVRASRGMHRKNGILSCELSTLLYAVVTGKLQSQLL